MTGRMHAFDAEQESLLREAAAWRLIGLLLECPGGGWQTQVDALASEVPDERLRQAAASAAMEASEGTYYALLGPGGPVSPREVTYLGGVQLGYLMAELRAQYDAFGFQPATVDPDDHVAVEVAFRSYLAVKQAYALVSGDTEHAAITAEAAGQFEREHLARLASPLAERLAVMAPSYLATAGAVLLQRVGALPYIPLAPVGLTAGDDFAGEMCCGDAAPIDQTRA